MEKGGICMIWYLLTAIFATCGMVFVIQETIRLLLLTDHRPDGWLVEVLRGNETEVVRTLRLIRLKIRLEESPSAARLILVADALSEPARAAAEDYCLKHQLPLPSTLAKLGGELDIACKREGSAVQ